MGGLIPVIVGEYEDPYARECSQCGHSCSHTALLWDRLKECPEWKQFRGCAHDHNELRIGCYECTCESAFRNIQAPNLKRVN